MTIKFKEDKKQVVVVYNSDKMVKPKSTDYSYPIPDGISSQMILTNLIKGLDKRIDNRSRTQAIIIS